VGAKPDDVIKKYVKLVGLPVMPPMWAFGWQCKEYMYYLIVFDRVPIWLDN
jgi:alpha-glucosidase (family GH31 glycosyl hydrolase)